MVGILRSLREYRPVKGQNGAVLIAGNWKMFKGPSETAGFCADLMSALASSPGVDVVVCPPFTSLRAAVESGLTTYAQNVHWEREGAFTGEVAAEMLLEVGVRGSVVGHSERRQHFGETDQTTARRAEGALEAGLAVIACVGETEVEREAGETEEVLRRQVSVLPQDDRLVVAYEPVWAIGTGKTATPEMAQDAHAFIKSLIDAPVLYGGSVKPENAEELLAEPDVDGALVGGASLDVESFTAICQSAARHSRS
jgi:triosephosphate isomerase (TIM)